MSKQFKLLTCVFFLYIIGLVMIFNTSSAEVLDHHPDRSTHAALFKQIGAGMIGALACYTTYRIGYDKLLSISPILLLFFSLLLALVLIPGIGVMVNGSRRWMWFLGMSIQPSEFVKYVCLLYFTYCILQVEGAMTLERFLKILAVLAIPLVLILLEPNNGTAGVIVISLSALFFLTKVPFRFWGLPLVGFVCVATLFALNMPYVKARLQVYLHPELDLKGKGHQPHQAKIASGSGGFWGKGPGQSVQKLSYLPEAQNDYIAAIYAEEYGFLGMLVLIGLYGWLAYLGFSCAIFAQDKASLYIAGSFTFLVSLQAFLNLGVVSGIVPSTGLNLPFFSQGGSSLISNSAGLGVLMSIAAKQKRLLWAKP
jgi:cell division protein FtsW